MKATGVVRRVDELGRIVVPKEIRKNLRIRTGTPLEIFIDEAGSVIFKKHSQIAEMADFASGVADALSAANEVNALVVDMDKIIAVAGERKREYLNSTISAALEEIISNRKSTLLNKLDNATIIPLKRDDACTYSAMVICPVMANGDCYGAVVIFSVNETDKFGECEIKVAQTMAQFLSKNLEN